MALRALSTGALLAVLSAATDCSYPGGNCYELRMQKCPGSQQLTIHGLWAQWATGCSGPSFAPDDLEPILGEMEKVWFSCPAFHTGNQAFWKHEWQKHGTCSGMSELAFFNRTIELYQEHSAECQDGNSQCSICFSNDFSTVETCDGTRETILV